MYIYMLKRKAITTFKCIMRFNCLSKTVDMLVYSYFVSGSEWHQVQRGLREEKHTTKFKLFHVFFGMVLLLQSHPLQQQSPLCFPPVELHRESVLPVIGHVRYQR